MAATPPNSASVRRRRLKEDYVSIYERFLKETVQHAEKIKEISPAQRNRRQEFYHREHPAFYKKIQENEKYIKLLLGAAEIENMYENALRSAAVYSALLELKMSIIELKINSMTGFSEKENEAKIEKLKMDYNSLKEYGENYTEFFKHLDECKEKIEGLNKEYSKYNEYCKKYIQLLCFIEEYKKKIIEFNKEAQSHREYDKKLDNFFKNSIEESRENIKKLNEENSEYYMRHFKTLDKMEDNAEKIKWLKGECARHHEAYYEAHKSILSRISQSKKNISEIYSAVPSRLKDWNGFMFDRDDPQSHPGMKLSDGLDRLNETYYQQGYDEARHVLSDLIYIYHPDTLNAPNASSSMQNDPQIETVARRISPLSLPKAADSRSKNAEEDAVDLLSKQKEVGDLLSAVPFFKEDTFSLFSALSSPFKFFQTASSSEKGKQAEDVRQFGNDGVVSAPGML